MKRKRGIGSMEESTQLFDAKGELNSNFLFLLPNRKFPHRRINGSYIFRRIYLSLG